jgi:hypothetical protein
MASERSRNGFVRDSTAPPSWRDNMNVAMFVMKIMGAEWRPINLMKSVADARQPDISTIHPEDRDGSRNS